MDPDVVLDLNIHRGADVDGRLEYKRFIGQLRDELADHPLREYYIKIYGPWLENRPLLCVQQPEQPPRWIHINLIVRGDGGVEEKRTTIAVRDDNVFLIGFKNKNNKWYEFGITDDTNTHLITGSTFLGCDMGYPDLVGGWPNLVRLSLTKYEAIRAVLCLSEHEAAAANEVTRHHLARICVMISESARMKPHYDTVILAWNPHNNASRLSVDNAKYTTNWSCMSSHLLSMLDPSPVRTSLLGVVHLLFNKIKRHADAGQHQQEQTPGGGVPSNLGSGSDSQPTGASFGGPGSSSDGRGGAGTQQQPLEEYGGKYVRGQPLVEVFSVKANFHDIGTIAIFDGKRGQIIYKHGNQNRSEVALVHGTWDYSYLANQLVLTGPYKAISGDRSFAIKVHASETADNSIGYSNVIGEVLMDCCNDDDDYNKDLTCDIINTYTGEHLAKVAYTVWKDALEATIEVNLLLPGSSCITRVCGTIFANDERFGRTGIVLFNRHPNDKVELVPSSDSMVPLKLRRSVIAVPLGSYRYLHVELHAATGSNDEIGVLLEGTMEFRLMRFTREIENKRYGSSEFMAPMGWTGKKSMAGSHGRHGATTSPSLQGTQTNEQQVRFQVNVITPGFHVPPRATDFVLWLMHLAARDTFVRHIT